MRKLMALAMAIAMVFTVALANVGMAEGADENFIGRWYVTQILTDGVSLPASRGNIQFEFIFNVDGSGQINATANNGQTSETPCAWTKDEQGNYLFMDQKSQVMKTMVFDENGAIVLGDEQEGMILSRTQGELQKFAATVAAKSADEFNGKYAVTNLSGYEFSMTVDRAIEELSVLGVNSTSVNISDGSVELFGESAQQYEFDAETGTLNYKASDEAEALNVKIFKTEDGGIAINWFGMTFYATALD